MLKWLVEINQSMITMKEENEVRLRSEIERMQQEKQEDPDQTQQDRDDFQEEVLRPPREILEEQHRPQQVYTAAERHQPDWVEVRRFGHKTAQFLLARACPIFHVSSGIPCLNGPK